MATEQTFFGFDIAPGDNADVFIPNDPSAAQLRLAELKTSKEFTDLLMSPFDPRHRMADRAWRALHVAAGRKRT